MDEKFTLIVPTYNTARYVRDAIMSVANQDCDNWECQIVIDPECDRETREILTTTIESLKQSDKFIISTANKHGLQHVMRYAIDIVDSDICGVLDSDDLLYPNSISRSLQEYSDPSVGFTWSIIVTSNGSAHGRDLGAYADMFSAFYDSSWWRSQHFRTFRKSWYLKSSGIPTEYEYAIDYALACAMAESGCKCVYIPEPLYWYRTARVKSITRSDPRRQKQCYVEMKKRWKLRNSDKKIYKVSPSELDRRAAQREELNYTIGTARSVIKETEGISVHRVNKVIREPIVMKRRNSR